MSEPHILTLGRIACQVSLSRLLRVKCLTKTDRLISLVSEDNYLIENVSAFAHYSQSTFSVYLFFMKLIQITELKK